VGGGFGGGLGAQVSGVDFVRHLVKIIVVLGRVLFGQVGWLVVFYRRAFLKHSSQMRVIFFNTFTIPLII